MSPRRIVVMISRAVCPSTGGCSVSSAYRIPPSENTSDCSSTSPPFPSACSGDMYNGVPTTSPSIVIPTPPVSRINSAAAIDRDDEAANDDDDDNDEGTPTAVASAAVASAVACP